MAKKQKKGKQKTPHTNHVVLGLILILLALIAFGGMIGGAGIAGFIIAEGMYWLVGFGSILIPLALGTAGVLCMRKRPLAVIHRQVISGTIGMVSLLTLFSLNTPSYGGIIGGIIAAPLIASFDTIFATIILLFVTLISFTVFFDQTPHVGPLFANSGLWIKKLFSKRTTAQSPDELSPTTEEEREVSYVLPAHELNDEKAAAPLPPASLKVTDASAAQDLIIETKRPKRGGAAYIPPPLSLLEGDRGKANVGDVKANANIIRRTLSNFGIEVEMDEVTIGPTVTRYALKPAQGVKLSRIVGLQNDLALSLAAHPLRIEAPIPGKSLVGIEIPNKAKATVGLAGLLSDPQFTNAAKPLTVALGRNISGKPYVRSITSMPHLLIAGTTGSGKSVTIHAIITSLLYRHGPDDLRFIFVDPKRVELTLYNGIPHLLTPVITDSKKAILALKWAASEMNRRYDILESESARDITSYHRKYASAFAKPSIDENDPDRMPYIVIVIDELADIMQAFPRELEAAIVRLAQMSRAVGIHLILSTQRPEVNVITGLIKANVPARIALRVPTQIDSRTILDAGGAEKLLGQGDMLAIIGESQAERLQSAFISEEEVKGVVKYLKDAFRDDVRDTIELSGTVGNDKTMFSDSMEGDEDDDPLYEEARATVIEIGKASTSYIQRKLKVGYARAARLMDMLEERGVIGAADGAKPREVLEKGLSSATSDVVADEMGI
ncbi:MAG TPA: DNA translocase FtsK 4TM domain-containing protein [Candidatus Paceibacterota bacterium]|nr:DNA translocase FtsK 4TM domain-containing protein [Candidatus Paceibacterota bacterium]